MKTSSPWVCLSVVLLATAPLTAQTDPPTGPAQILVKLQPQPGNQPRRITIGPRAAGVCQQAVDCSDHFTIRWIGAGNEGEKIRIRFIDTEAAGKCFDATDFTIDEPGPTNQKAVTLRAERPECTGKHFFFFEVSCVGGEGGDCGGVAAVDPGAMVDGGGGSG